MNIFPIENGEFIIFQPLFLCNQPGFFVQPAFSPSFPSSFSAQAPTTTGPTTSEAVGSDLGSCETFGWFSWKKQPTTPLKRIHFAARPGSLGAPKGERFFFFRCEVTLVSRRVWTPNFFPKFLIAKFPVPTPNSFFWVVFFFVFHLLLIYVTSQTRTVGKCRIRRLAYGCLCC